MHRPQVDAVALLSVPFVQDGLRMNGREIQAERDFTNNEIVRRCVGNARSRSMVCKVAWQWSG